MTGELTPGDHIQGGSPTTVLPLWNYSQEAALHQPISHRWLQRVGTNGGKLVLARLWLSIGPTEALHFQNVAKTRRGNFAPGFLT